MSRVQDLKDELEATLREQAALMVAINCAVTGEPWPPPADEDDD